MDSLESPNGGWAARGNHMARRNATIGKEKDQLTLRMDGAHFEALAMLVPGFGSNVSEVARYIIIDWLKTNLGIDRMRSLGLIK